MTDIEILKEYKNLATQSGVKQGLVVPSRAKQSKVKAWEGN